MSDLRPLPAPSRLGAEACANALRELAWRAMVVIGVPANAEAQRRLGGEDALASRARREVLIDRERARPVELLIEVRVQAALRFGAESRAAARLS